MLGVGGQVDEQALGNERRRFRRVEPAVTQGLWPIIAQIDGNLPALRGRRVAMRGQHLPLELEHPWLVQLEHHRPIGPGQPVAAGVESGGKQHDLAHPGCRGGVEIGIEVSGPNALEVDEMFAELGLQRVFGRAAVEQVGPLAAYCPAEHFGIRIDRRGVRFLGLQGPRRGHE